MPVHDGTGQRDRMSYSRAALRLRKRQWTSVRLAKASALR
jgi:hypothetical protein